ncbi:hypothetical protein [Kutzneria chonburiensis]|uniref:DUF3592 domain-containing protein n=1 Tax=Kutzneria chonburiensis TaxID=1483604 RepID=A0ABV6MSN4_9PSEU|nr:hypothetical protein [Kutzneria chonburiensis]
MRRMWRILLGLGLPVLYAGLVLAYAWNLVDGPPELVRAVLGIAIILAVLLTGFAFIVFTAASGFAISIALAIVAGIALFGTGVAGLDELVLHERGHDVTCTVTGVTETSIGYAPAEHYALNCDGGHPTDYTSGSDDLTVGQQVEIRYDPTGTADTTLSSNAADGHVLLTIAAVALALFLFTGAVTASRTSRPSRPRSEPTPGTPGRAD